MSEEKGKHCCIDKGRLNNGLNKWEAIILAYAFLMKKSI